MDTTSTPFFQRSFPHSRNNGATAIAIHDLSNNPNLYLQVCITILGHNGKPAANNEDTVAALNLFAERLTTIVGLREFHRGVIDSRRASATFMLNFAHGSNPRRERREIDQLLFPEDADAEMRLLRQFDHD